MVPQDFLDYLKYTCPVRTDPLLQSGVLVLVLVFVRVCVGVVEEIGPGPPTPDRRDGFETSFLSAMDSRL